MLLTRSFQSVRWATFIRVGVLLTSLTSWDVRAAAPSTDWVPLSSARFHQLQQSLTRSLCLHPDVEGIGVISQRLNLPDASDLQVSVKWREARDSNDKWVPVQGRGAAIGGDQRWSASASVKGAVSRVDLVLTIRSPAVADAFKFSCVDEGVRKETPGVAVVLTRCRDAEFSVRQTGSTEQPLLHAFGKSGRPLALDYCEGRTTRIYEDAGRLNGETVELGCTVQTSCGPRCKGPADPLASVLWVHPRRWESIDVPVSVTRQCDEKSSQIPSK